MRYNPARVIVHHHKAIGRVSDDRFKDLARMSETLVESALADRDCLNQVLLSVEKHNPEQFTIQKAHLGTKLGNDCRTIDYGIRRRPLLSRDELRGVESAVIDASALS
jgi:hypothetical protein